MSKDGAHNLEMNLPSEDGIFLPPFLYYFKEDSKLKSVLPSANFNPVAAALNGANPFAGLTSPSSDVNKRTIIIDATTFIEPINLGRAIALIKRLKIAKFTILLRTKSDDITHEIDDKLTDIAAKLKNLAEFDQKSDYDKIQKTASQSIVLNCTKLKDIEESLDQNSYQDSGFSGTDWRSDFRMLSLEQIEQLLQPEEDPRFSDKRTSKKSNEIIARSIIFCIKHCPPALILDLIEKYFQLNLPLQEKSLIELIKAAPHFAKKIIVEAVTKDLDVLNFLKILIENAPVAQQKELAEQYRDQSQDATFGLLDAINAFENRLADLNKELAQQKKLPAKYHDQAQDTLLDNLAKIDALNKKLADLNKDLEKILTTHEEGLSTQKPAEVKDDTGEEIYFSAIIRDLEINPELLPAIMDNLRDDQESQRIIPKFLQTLSGELLEKFCDNLICNPQLGHLLIEASNLEEAKRLLARYFSINAASATAQSIANLEQDKFLIKALNAKPELAQFLIDSIEENKIAGFSLLAMLIKSFPDKESELLRKYYNGIIQKDIAAEEILQTVSLPVGERFFIDLIRHMIDNNLLLSMDKIITKAPPQYSKILVENLDKDLIKNATLLLDLTDILPDCIDELLKKYAGGIEYNRDIIFKLSLENHPPSAKELMEKYSTGFLTEEMHKKFIKEVIKAIPEYAESFIARFGHTIYDAIHGNENGAVLLRSLPTKERNTLIDAGLGPISWLPRIHEGPDDARRSISQNVTYLYIANLENKEQLAALTERIRGGEFAKVSTVEIVNIKDENFLKYLTELLPEVKHWTLPKALMNLDIAKDLTSVEFIDYKKFLHFDEIIPHVSKAFKSKAAGIRSEPRSRPFAFATEASMQQDLKPGQVFIADGQPYIKTKIKAHSAFKMASAGEVLNDKTLVPEIRTSLLRINDIKTNLDQRRYLPSKFEKLPNARSVSAEDVSKFARLPADRHVFYRFNQQLPANERVRLLSADAAEELVGIVNGDSSILIERGDDDFFYATSLRPQTISYVTKAPSPQEQRRFYASIAQNKVKEIIEDYKDSAKGHKLLFDETTLLPDYKALGHRAWLTEIFNRRNIGSCTQRVAAVVYKLETEGLEQGKDFRIVDINGNHVALEIKHNNSWASANLGGSASNLDYKSATGQTYVAPSFASQMLPPQAEAMASAGDSLKAEAASATLPQGHLPKISPKAAPPTIDPVALKITEILKKALHYDKIANKEHLREQISSAKKILITTPNIEGHANFLLEESRTKKRLTFYIDAPDKIDINSRRVFIGRSPDGTEKTPILRTTGLLEDFLQAADNCDPENPPLLIINWSTFSAAERLMLNTLLDLDKARTIKGRPLNDAVQIIGLSDKPSKDTSFLARNDLRISSNVIFASSSAKKIPESEPRQVIDLKGFPDWQRALFGPIISVGPQMRWQKSPFAIALQEERKHFEIINLSKEAEQELNYQFNQAKARGFFIYNGLQINLPDDFSIKCQKKSLDFSNFQDRNRVLVAQNVTFDQAPKGTKIINTFLFDYLLQGKEIAEGFYKEAAGWIEEAAQSEDHTLEIFISSQLSESQYYCMLSLAQELDVILKLYLAPSVSLPSDVNFSYLEQRRDQAKVANAQIYITNNADEMARGLTDQDIFAVFDIEDLNYRDLVDGIDFEVSDDGFHDFKKTPSEILQKLLGLLPSKTGRAAEDDRKIILKGKFSRELLQILEPLMIGQSPDFQHLARNLIFIIEDKEISPPSKYSSSPTTYKELNWLPNSAYKVQHFKERPIKKVAGYKEIFDTSLELPTDSARKANEFIASRKSEFEALLRNHDIVQMTGHSGVGKSSLLKEFAKTDKDRFSIHYGIDQLDKWALDEQTGKTKVLFLDEANMLDLHLTTFSSFKDKLLDGVRRITHKGKIYELDKTWKVVVAGNPNDHGGKRFEQSLFADGKIPEMYLRDFPVSYIYEKILKEEIYDKQKVREIISEDQFREYCGAAIEIYQTNNCEHSTDLRKVLTVRELQENVLQYLLKYLEASQSDQEVPDDVIEYLLGQLYTSKRDATEPPPLKSLNLKTENFISTDATIVAENILSDAINIRQKQRRKIFPKDAVGLNGVLLEGESGTGKSELIRAIFEKHKIREKKFVKTTAASLLENPPSKPRQYLPEEPHQRYYKVNALLSFEEKKEIILQAFEEGNIALLEEIDADAAEMEELLNHVSTGHNPDTKKPASKAGFLWIASANGVNLEGRSTIPLPLRHRSISAPLKTMKEYSLEALTKIITQLAHSYDENFTEENPLVKQIATDFKHILTTPQGADFNLRVLKSSMPEVIEEVAKIMGIDITTPILTTTRRPSSDAPLPTPSAKTTPRRRSLSPDAPQSKALSKAMTGIDL